jgi:hypothetical protein
VCRLSFVLVPRLIFAENQKQKPCVDLSKLTAGWVPACTDVTTAAEYSELLAFEVQVLRTAILDKEKAWVSVRAMPQGRESAINLHLFNWFFMLY